LEALIQKQPYCEFNQMLKDLGMELQIGTNETRAVTRLNLMKKFKEMDKQILDIESIS
jgi:hypothetical protein